MKIEDMTDLDIVRMTLRKFDVKYHEIDEGDSVYIQAFEKKDQEGKLFVEGYGLVDLKLSGQLINFIEFYKGEIVSY